MSSAPVHNAGKTCWNCPAVEFKGHVDFRACGQAAFRRAAAGQLVVECKRREEIGYFDPMSITFDACPEYGATDYGYLLKGMRVMILGMDGYLGWPLALKLAALGCRVFGIDNGLRRQLVAQRGAQSVLPIGTMAERLAAARAHLGVEIDFRALDLCDGEAFFAYVEEVRPEAFVQYAEIPSAPYSMASLETATRTITNNNIGTLNLMFAMRDLAPEASVIKLGTMGEYGSPLTGRPLFEGLFPGDAVLQYGDDEWSLGGELVPRDPVSFYHVSKVQGTFTMYESCKYWWLRGIDVMQGVVYGLQTPELGVDATLNTRLDIDEWWGTVINRFVAQAVVGAPLTIFGSGHQRRGYITIADAMQCMVRLLASPPEPGQYDVVNQVTQVLTVKELAQTVARIGRDEFGLAPAIQRIENPRVEAEEHPYEVVHHKLTEEYGFRSEAQVAQEVRYMFCRLLAPACRERIEAARETLFPTTLWSGAHKRLEVVEATVDY